MTLRQELPFLSVDNYFNADKHAFVLNIVHHLANVPWYQVHRCTADLQKTGDVAVLNFQYWQY